MHLLVVDDDPGIRASLGVLLQSWGFEALQAADAAEATRIVERQEPDIVITDLVMPEMNGLEAARELCREHPGAPILMVTIDPSQELEAEAKKAGIRGICKKSDMKSLLAAIETVLNGKTYFPRMWPA